MAAQGQDIQQIDGYPVLHIRGTKTANADRFVPIPEDFYQKIKKTPQGRNICLTRAGTPYNTISYRRLFHRLRREMNIALGCRVYRNQLIPPFPLAEDFVPYCLRHTYCTDLQKKGVDIRTAQYLMGHADIQMTANIYTHADQSTITKAAEPGSCLRPKRKPAQRLKKDWRRRPIRRKRSTEGIHMKRLR